MVSKRKCDRAQNNQGKSASDAFKKKPSVSNLISADKALKELSKECKGFWAKHKDAPQDKAVTNALKIYDEVATQASNDLATLVKSVQGLENADKSGAVKDLKKDLHIT